MPSDHHLYFTFDELRQIYRSLASDLFDDHPLLRRIEEELKTAMPYANGQGGGD